MMPWGKTPFRSARRQPACGLFYRSGNSSQSASGGVGCSQKDSLRLPFFMLTLPVKAIGHRARPKTLLRQNYSFPERRARPTVRRSQLRKSGILHWINVVDGGAMLEVCYVLHLTLQARSCPLPPLRCRPGLTVPRRCFVFVRTLQIAKDRRGVTTCAAPWQRSVSCRRLPTTRRMAPPPWVGRHAGGKPRRRFPPSIVASRLRWACEAGLSPLAGNRPAAAVQAVRKRAGSPVSSSLALSAIACFLSAAMLSAACWPMPSVTASRIGPLDTCP